MYCMYFNVYRRLEELEKKEKVKRGTEVRGGLGRTADDDRMEKAPLLPGRMEGYENARRNLDQVISFSL